MGMHIRVAMLVLAALIFGLAVHAGAAMAEAPQLAISVSTDGSGAEDEGSEVITTGPSGEGLQRLVGGPGASIGDALSWSADGDRLAFGVSGVESTASGPFGTGWQVVGVAGVDGQVQVFPRAFLNAGEPVMAPDGRSVAFQRAKVLKSLPGRENYLFKSAIWLLDVEDGSVRRLTRWRFASFLGPISYLHDGSGLVGVLVDRRGRRIVAVDLHNHRSRLLALLGKDASEPTYSPDGSRLAFVRLKYLNNPKQLPARPVSELLVARGDGSGARRVLRRRGYISFPSWDPSGSRLAFTRDSPAEGTGLREPEPGNSVMAINADGTCLTRVFTDSEIIVYGSAWQPGVGREAGPISC
jgi:Tol biopolymer transport system component